MVQNVAASRTGTPNRLIDSTSPYLLQHAHNPVEWYPWGTEALEKARREDKPIFLSIGYSACHWCHVMERESFENPAIAEILNRNFVSIKVDREERPDLDELYMKATILYNQGSGGWPMSVFLIPDDQTPFFAGTYFPSTSRYGRPGFADLLVRIAELWRSDREKVREGARSLSEAVRQFSQPTPLEGGIDHSLVRQAADRLASAFDPDRGGLLSGGTNKFPPSMAMSLMLREYERTRREGRPNEVLLRRVTVTLDHMADGGIYDHLAGGIARYSTDPDWLVPHFEKMLYDQALVSGVYLEAHQVTGERRYGDVARQILDFVLTDLTSDEGAFYSAWDADSEGQEGRYYVWSKSEVMDALGPRVGELFCSYYDVTEQGNWEGHNILNIQRDAVTVAKLHGISSEELDAALREARDKLLTIRRKRVPPNLDDKTLTGWNALMISSLARGGTVLDEPRYIEAAAKAATFILSNLRQDGRLLRTWRKGKAHTPAYQEDYAFFVEALLDLHQAGLDWQWLDLAAQLNEDMLNRFADEQQGAFYFTAADAESLFARTKEYRDAAIPNGNSVAIVNLVRLGTILDRSDFLDGAERAIRAVGGESLRSPFGHERLLVAIDLFTSSLTEVVVVGPAAAAQTQGLLAVAREGYDPARILLVLDPSSPDAADRRSRVPLLAGKGAINGRPTAYVCRDRSCLEPVTSPDELRAQLAPCTAEQ